MPRSKIAVLGAGSWGTALAIHLSRLGHDVRLWARRSVHAEAMARQRENAQYLPNIDFPQDLLPTADLERALDGADLALSVVPAQTTRSVWMEARPFLGRHAPVVSASKGIESDTLMLMSELLHDVLPGRSLAFIAGPSFAHEVARQLPTAVVIGSKQEGLADDLQQVFSSGALRAYSTRDVVGIELGGAVKNVIAIACGCADGLGFGQNARAAIITRGLAEITRMAVALGAEPRTLSGLGGLGDLVLTCTGDLSRNRRVGLGLGRGQTLPTILSEMGQVAEGVTTAAAVHALAERTGVEMPICTEIHRMLHEDKPARDVVIALMGRDLKPEIN